MKYSILPYPLSNAEFGTHPCAWRQGFARSCQYCDGCPGEIPCIPQSPPRATCSVCPGCPADCNLCLCGGEDQ